ncbi:MAG: glycosyltransferase family 9 protein [Ignavibacteriaceae bacterium]
MYKKIINLFNFLVFLILLPFINNKKIKPLPDSILIIRLDAIGDYVLFRNFIRILKESSKYRNYKITLCGNIIWKELAECLDGDVVDDFIWIDRKKFYGNLIYKYKILSEIHNRRFEIAIETTYSRDILYGDEIIRVSRAKERIGNTGSLDKHANWKRNLFSDRWYTKLIQSKENNVFEFYRNKEFFSNLLETNIDIKKPSIDVSGIFFNKLAATNYIVLFPGGSSEKRRWNINNFLEVAKYILDNSNYDIVVDGSKKEIKLAQYIWDNLKSQRVFITAGSTSLTEMAKLLSAADLLISNETSAVHFAAAVNTKFICISNGTFYNRFHPYPKEVFNDSYYIYPDEIINNPDFNKDIYRFESSLDINQIKPEKVKEVLKKLIN